MKYQLLLLFNLLVLLSSAQRNDCGTPSPKTAIYPDSISARAMRTAVTYPLLMKVFVHVIADDNGANVAAGDSSVMRQMQNMKSFYAPHGICFILAGYEQINSSDLNNHNSSTEENDLTPFLVPDVLNIFVHTTLFNNSGGLNGTAYGIPNYYLSISRGAITSTDNLSTLAHEMGHDFGLYHTFQTRTTNSGDEIFENVPRSGSCSNCTTEGDLLCDTPADREISDVNISSTTCLWLGTQTDECREKVTGAPNNIMTYGRRSCRSVFTVAQGNRCEDFILSRAMLSNAIAPDNLTIAANINVSAGRRFYLARNAVIVSASSVSISGTATANIGAKEVIISPGSTFSPTGNGYTVIRANTLCQ